MRIRSGLHRSLAVQKSHIVLTKFMIIYFYTEIAVWYNGYQQARSLRRSKKYGLIKLHNLSIKVNDGMKG